MTYTNHAFPPHLLLRVLDILEEEISRLISVVETLEMRFIGSSVLVVYEGDETRLAAAITRCDSRPTRPDPIDRDADDPYPIDEEDEDDDKSDLGESSTSSSDNDEDDGVKADERRARRCPPLSLRLIDFAHTMLVEGEGPDEGVLMGLRTLRGLVLGRMKEGREYVEKVGIDRMGGRASQSGR